MIDIEQEVFTGLSEHMSARIQGLAILGELSAEPAEYPAMAMIEADNAAYQRSLGQSGREQHALLRYEICAYSNLSSGRKAQCRQILKEADAYMSDLGFLRTALLTAEPGGGACYRMTAVYRAVAGQDGRIYRELSD